MEMRERLTAILNEFDSDTGVRVVILQGAAPSFCAGVDLSETAPSAGHVLADAPVSVSAPFAAFTKPLFASVNGAAAGGGLEIALACDFMIASTTAKFLLPEVRIGSLPGGGGTQRLVRALPRGVAARMLYTGDTMDAASALAYGLVTQLVEPEALEVRARVGDTVAANAPLSLAAIKQCLKGPRTHRSTSGSQSSVVSGVNSRRARTASRVVARFARNDLLNSKESNGGVVNHQGNGSKAVIAGVGASPGKVPRFDRPLSCDRSARALIADSGIDKDDIDGLLTMPGTTSLEPPKHYSTSVSARDQPRGQARCRWAARPVVPSCNRPPSTSRPAWPRPWCASSATRPRPVDRVSGRPGRARHGGTGACSVTPDRALGAPRHMALYGTTSEQFGWVAVNGRYNASLNPEAVMRDPITLEDHQASR